MKAAIDSDQGRHVPKPRGSGGAAAAPATGRRAAVTDFGQGMSAYSVTRLQPSAARLAYPLVRAAEPLVDLNAWLAYVRGAEGRKRGVMVATRAGGAFPSGMFCYACARDPALGQVMTANYIVALDILDPAPLTAALMAALEALAAELGCDAIRAFVSGGAPDIEAALRARGHRVEATAFQKWLA